eukprot:jgi/Undpi1/1967/HiC_scaffold_12.g05354.m1
MPDATSDIGAEPPDGGEEEDAGAESSLSGVVSSVMESEMSSEPAKERLAPTKYTRRPAVLILIHRLLREIM